ncbi:MAB_1171c family putative transporter [Streptomyces hokutonensis]|uniref:MAB_1171c family putative transporter n=1 Tax=Streptomyces hokutonensis TaxID=1306990 RepID=UPI00035DB62D|nr:MAB_1171c family putative transporter [Streptomyces hokutonensis]
MSAHFHIPYAIPTALLAIALLLKLPTLVRAWRDPNVKATTLLLAFATAVLVVITPVNIERLNQLTGVPNIASPWAYSFLTAFCATALTMIMRWREEPSAQRQRRMRRIYWIYAGIVVLLWVTFLLAHVPEPRIYDLDTYYASTPWMSEHILLYLGAHMVTSVVATSMLVKWFPKVENRWLKSGVVFLQLGFTSGLLYDTTKLIAIGARWSGHNWDSLSTNVAPPFALLSGILVAMGFIVPQAGPLQQRWFRDRREYRHLRALWRALYDVTPSSAPARFGLWVPLDLRLVQRQQRIHDALRVLAPYFDQDLYQKAHQTALADNTEEKACALARAVTVRAAIDAHRTEWPSSESLTARQLEFGTDMHEHIDTIAQALHRPRLVDSIRQRVTSTESADTYAP